MQIFLSFAVYTELVSLSVCVVRTPLLLNCVWDGSSSFSGGSHDVAKNTAWQPSIRSMMENGRGGVGEREEKSGSSSIKRMTTEKRTEDVYCTTCCV